MRAARHFDGWFPFGPNVETVAQRQQEFVTHAKNAGRCAGDLTTAIYLTVGISNQPEQAETKIDAYLESYYGVPAKVMRSVQACYAGTPSQVADWIRGYVQAGASRAVLRLVGDHGLMLEELAKMRADIESDA